MRLSLSKLSLLASVGASAVALLSAQAGAGDHPMYISMFGGGSFLNDVTSIKQESGGQNYSASFNTGYIIGGAFGVHVNDRLRGEIEMSHAGWSAKGFSGLTNDGGVTSTASGTLDATYLLANLWFDLPNNHAVTPYLGGGLGVGFVNANVLFNNFNHDDGYTGGGTGLAFQIGGGLKKALTDKIDFDVGYRFKGITGINFGSLENSNQPYNGANLYSHNLQLGLTFKF